MCVQHGVLIMALRGRLVPDVSGVGVEGIGVVSDGRGLSVEQHHSLQVIHKLMTMRHSMTIHVLLPTSNLQNLLQRIIHYLSNHLLIMQFEECKLLTSTRVPHQSVSYFSCSSSEFLRGRE